MCTAIAQSAGDFYFGRNLDLDHSYGEKICVLGREAPLSFMRMGDIREHYAIIGMATVIDGTPLFYDGANECGLCAAALNFPHNAYYFSETAGKDNVTPFELIVWILSQCKSIGEARELLLRMNIADIPYSDSLPNTTLHWMIADRERALTVESMADGLRVYENPVGVLTNNPPFKYQLFNLNNYRNLSTKNRECSFGGDFAFDEYSSGLGAIGLPGDVSSTSRFVRAAFAKANSVSIEDEESAVSQFFHLLSFVHVPRGMCITARDTLFSTVYSACINADRGIYYYTTYDNSQITAVDMHRCALDSSELYRYPLIFDAVIRKQN